MPRFCKADYKGGWNTGATVDEKNAGEKRLREELAEILDAAGCERFAAEVQMSWVVNISQRGEKKTGEESRKRLLASVAHFGQYFGTHRAKTKTNPRTAEYLARREHFQGQLADIEERLKVMEADQLPEIPPNERSIPDRLEALLLFKHFPCLELVDLLKFLFPPSKPTAESEKAKGKKTAGPNFAAFGDDAIRMARGQRGYVYRGFTSLKHFNPENTPEMAWFEFELEAFKEALKALNQIRTKGEERDSRRTELECELDYMLGGTAKYDSGEAETEAPPVLAGDPRIEQLEKMLDGLKQAYDMTDEEAEEYGMHERTIRGFPELARKWNHIHPGRLETKDAARKLREALAEYQTENRDTIGSAALFEKLTEPENWIIWREPDDETARKWEEANFGKNPLAVLLRKRETEEEIERLKEPIRFTPADARHSPRQYCLGNRTTFDSKAGAYRHEANRLSVLAGLVVWEGDTWAERRVRLNYSAPRLLREGLRGGEEHLEQMPWVQPMMEALGIRDEMAQDMHSYAVFMMPREQRDGSKSMLLNFPVTLEPDVLVEKLGKKARWAGQFAGGKDKNVYLRWPADEWPKNWKGGRWYERREPFRLLSVDLGQRDAGAFALLECRPDKEFWTNARGGQPPCRMAGEAGGCTWWAAVEKTGLLRLPGEDAKVLRKGKWEQELSGEKGRLASAEESRAARELAERLGDATMLDGSRRQRFFAEQNRLLLLALRRAQGRMARLHRWSWMLNDEKRAARAKEEMAEPDALLPEPRRAAEEGKWELVAMWLEREIEEAKGLLEGALVAIANRVLPMKGRKWKWIARPDGAGHVLEQGERGSDFSPTLIAGQRGLSMERIEMVEELRKRCQSLNRALMRKTGERARMGRAARGMELPDPCPEVLEKLDRLRDQRVNQTAHLILAEALGVRLKPHAKSEEDRRTRDVHGEYEQMREPVDFIVVEDLSRYMSSQGRSRGENSRLMKWCHRAVLTKLKQIAETYGLPVLEVAAAYSSRFSAKDGMPGFRAVEVGLGDLEQYPWKKALEKGEEGVERLAEMLMEVGEGPSRHRRTLLAPIAGGPLFVPMAGSVEQADINAAVNLGLRSIAAPDRLDIHLRIRTEKGKDGQIRPATKSKREQARWGKRPPAFRMEREESVERTANFFPLVGFDVDYEKATLEGHESVFATGKALWGTVKARQWETTAAINGQRIQRNGWGDGLRI